MSSPTAYLAHPIDRTDAHVNLLMANVVAHLRHSSHDVNLYMPSQAWSTGRTAGPAIKTINDYALENSDLLLVLWPEGATSWGVPAEVERALIYGIPIHIVTDVEPQARTWSQQYASGAQAVTWHDVNDPDSILGQVARWTGRAYQALGAALAQITRDPDLDGLVLEGNNLRDALPVKALGPLATLPTRGHDDDAGLDLYVDGYHTIHPGQWLDIPCGIAVELPPWSWGMLTGRSSTLRKRGLMVNPGVIDAGYRGPLYSLVYNPGPEVVQVRHGERLAQLILIENGTARVEPVWADRLSDHTRGQAGFGSTGA